MTFYSKFLPVFRYSTYIMLLSLITITGAQGQQAKTVLRIGLRTKQTEVRLRATVPVDVRVDEQSLKTVPAETDVVFTYDKDTGVTVTDGTDAAIVATQHPVRVVPAPNEGDVNTLPLIRLLGPGKHYDGKADRPYRGQFEILTLPEGLTAVNIVELEPYLYGVVSSEMSPAFPIEALKAQAIAARTYAVKNIGHFAKLGYDMDDTNLCQVYGGYFSEDPRTNSAIDETAGVVMTYKGKLIDAVYSSTCGGFTESSEKAWGNPTPYLVSVPDFTDGPWAIDPPKDETAWATFFKTTSGLNCLQPKYLRRTDAFRWVKLMTRKEVEDGLTAAQRVGTVQEIIPVRRGDSGRITELKIVGSERTVTLKTESTIHRAFGNLRSSAFTVDIYRDEQGLAQVFAFWGAGWGHGIGMCQVGAVGLADKGWSFEKILTYYYHGVSIERR